MKYRVEKKYIVSDADLMVLDARLKSVLPCDAHQYGSYYTIRSLYFDDAWDSGVDENEAGINIRKKYRIRHYDANAEHFKLEIKEKNNGYARKESCFISRETYQEIVNGDMQITEKTDKVFNNLYVQMKTKLLKPKVIIEYERTAYVYPVGNVRITFDRNISASSCCDDFLDESISKSVPVLPQGVHVLEVKYDELLPEFIAQLLDIGNLQQTAFSKYYLGRNAVSGEFFVT